MLGGFRLGIAPALGHPQGGAIGIYLAFGATVALPNLRPGQGRQAPGHHRTDRITLGDLEHRGDRPGGGGSLEPVGFKPANPRHPTHLPQEQEIALGTRDLSPQIKVDPHRAIAHPRVGERTGDHRAAISRPLHWHPLNLHPHAPRRRHQIPQATDFGFGLGHGDRYTSADARSINRRATVCTPVW